MRCFNTYSTRQLKEVKEKLCKKVDASRTWKKYHISTSQLKRITTKTYSGSYSKNLTLDGYSNLAKDSKGRLFELVVNDKWNVGKMSEVFVRFYKKEL